MGTPVSDDSTPIYQEDVSFGSSVSEALMGKIGAVVNYILNNTAILSGGKIPYSYLPNLNHVVSPSCGTFTITSSGEYAVTNLSVTITTTGRPVELRLIDDGSGSQAYISSNSTSGTSGTDTLRFKQNGSTVSAQYLAGSAVGTYSSYVSLYVPPSVFSTIIYPSAGTYTYTVTLYASHRANAINVKLLAREL